MYCLFFPALHFENYPNVSLFKTPHRLPQVILMKTTLGCGHWYLNYCNFWFTKHPQLHDTFNISLLFFKWCWDYPELCIFESSDWSKQLVKKNVLRLKSCFISADVCSLKIIHIHRQVLTIWLNHPNLCSILCFLSFMQMQREWQWKCLIFKTTVFSERYGLSFFGCILTIGAIYLFVTFGPNSHEQLKAENIVKHVVAWPVLLYLVRTTALSFFSLFCVTVLWNRHPSFKAVMLLLTQCWLNGTLLHGCVLGVFAKCMIYHRNVHKWVLLMSITNLSCMQTVIISRVMFAILQTAAVEINKISAGIRSSDETCSFLLTVTCNFSWH